MFENSKCYFSFISIECKWCFIMVIWVLAYGGEKKYRGSWFWELEKWHLHSFNNRVEKLNRSILWVSKYEMEADGQFMCLFRNAEVIFVGSRFGIECWIHMKNHSDWFVWINRFVVSTSRTHAQTHTCASSVPLDYFQAGKSKFNSNFHYAHAWNTISKPGNREKNRYDFVGLKLHWTDVEIVVFFLMLFDSSITKLSQCDLRLP